MPPPPPPPPPKPKPVKDGDTVVTKDAGKPKPASPAKDTDVKVIKWMPESPKTKK
jgi:hypothetical protein